MDLPSPTSRIIHGHSEQSRSLGNVRAINPPPPIQLPLQARDRHLRRAVGTRDGIVHDLENISATFPAARNVQEDNGARNS